MDQNCQRCGETLPESDLISLSDAGEKRETICPECMSRQSLEMAGMPYTPFKPAFFTVVDRKEDRIRKFKLERLIFPVGISFEATEETETEHGYRFVVFAELGSNEANLIRQLKTKTEKGVNKKYLDEHQRIAEDEAVCVIEYDENTATPLLVIDGKQMTWEQFGRKVMQFEGFKMNVKFMELDE